MTYTASQAFSPRGTHLEYQISASLGWVVAAELMQIDFSGQKLDLADVTNFQSGIFKEWLATLLDSGEVTFKGNFIPSDVTQQQMLGFFNTATRVNWGVLLPTNPSTGQTYGSFTFQAYVSSLEWGLPIDKQATVSGKLKVTGAITFQASVNQGLI